MEYVIFLAEKQDCSIKVRACANGSTQREYTSNDEATSPTVSAEAVMIRGVIDANQGRDAITADIPNAFVQTAIDHKKGQDRITMNIKCHLIDILNEISPETYNKYITLENEQRMPYVMMRKTLYRILISAVLLYKKLRKELERIGFKVNLYDVCVASIILNQS